MITRDGIEIPYPQRDLHLRSLYAEHAVLTGMEKM